MDRFVENRAAENDKNLSSPLMDTLKKFNQTKDKLRLADNAHNEMLALKQTVLNNIHVADYLSKQKEVPDLGTKNTSY